MFNISTVERDTGLSKDVLRVWERRYGFPCPQRDSNGDRIYSNDQVDRLRLIKKLMDHGYRPGKLVPASIAELNALVINNQSGPSLIADECDESILNLVDQIRAHDAQAYISSMQQHLARQGLQNFVIKTVAPLAQRIGQAWERGEIKIFEEHQFTELTKRILRRAIDGLQPIENPSRPRMLFTTLPGEQHLLGLMMVEVLSKSEGSVCISLGTETPITDIEQAVQAYHADIVALSFSAAFPSRQIPAAIDLLASSLGNQCELWVGGAGCSKVKKTDRINIITSLVEVIPALKSWGLLRPGVN